MKKTVFMIILMICASSFGWPERIICHQFVDSEDTGLEIKTNNGHWLPHWVSVWSVRRNGSQIELIEPLQNLRIRSAKKDTNGLTHYIGEKTNTSTMEVSWPFKMSVRIPAIGETIRGIFQTELYNGQILDGEINCRLRF